MNALEKDFLLKQFGKITRIVRDDYSSATDLLNLCGQFEDTLRSWRVKE